MLSKCANPECSTPFQYLREGKIFKVERGGPVLMGGKRPVSSVEHFWLCGPCSGKVTLVYDAKDGVRITARTQVLVKRAAAS